VPSYENYVKLIGTMDKDPAVRNVQIKHGARAGSEGTVANFSVEVRSGERASWFRVSAWHDAAHEAAKLRKGLWVQVEGRLQVRKWDKPDGTTQYITEIAARSVQGLSQPAPAQPAAMPDEDDDLPF
jgi:single-strand DNA-binding protein